MSIIYANKTNINAWVDLSIKLFPDHPFAEMYDTYHEYLINEEMNQREIGFLYQVNNQYVAFMNISVRRDYVNGTDTFPVVYIEAIYVLEAYRNRGIGRELIKKAMHYAKEQGIKQIASDCTIDNTVSELFHKSCGFEEAERVICFVKNVE